MASNASVSTLVIQFCKWPVAGEVKTRLIPALGVQGALAAHVTLSCAVLRNLLGSRYPVELWWDREPGGISEADSAVLTDLIGQSGVVQRVQKGEDLGQRMLGALADGLERAERVIIVGSDCPAVEAEYVSSAVEALEKADVVLGPAEDGGYVLIGARRLNRAMFDAVAWGTPGALLQTARSCEAVGLSAAQLEMRWDVDEVSDWRRFLQAEAK